MCKASIIHLSILLFTCLAVLSARHFLSILRYCSGNNLAPAKIAKNAHKHGFGINVLMEIETASFRPIGEHVIAPGEEEHMEEVEQACQAYEEKQEKNRETLY